MAGLHFVHGTDRRDLGPVPLLPLCGQGSVGQIFPEPGQRLTIGEYFQVGRPRDDQIFTPKRDLQN